MVIDLICLKFYGLYFWFFLWWFWFYGKIFFLFGKNRDFIKNNFFNLFFKKENKVILKIKVFFNGGV